MKEEIRENNIKQDIKESLVQLINHLLKKQASFCVFRLPQSQEITLLGNYEGMQEVGEWSMENSPEGFIFSTFNGKKLFLKADFHWNSTENEMEVEDKEEYVKGEKPNFYTLNKTVESTPEEDYKNYVKKSIEAVDSEKLNKVVPARIQVQMMEQGINLLDIFHQLCENYLNAFVSLVSSPETGTWMGASPEILVSTENQHIFKTAAVAGTQPYKHQKLSEVAWTQKEIEEQALVSRYIINCFKKIRLREFEEYGPKTVIAGNLLHLKTQFTVDMKETNFPELGSVMLKLLHPTSAVCGMPLEESMKFIRENERTDRSFFSGYLGPVNHKNKSSIFVNLRCLELLNDRVVLYAGAGVTQDSDPEKELRETQAKFDTIGNFL